MCNLYSITTNQDAGNLPSMPGVFPDQGLRSYGIMTVSASSLK
jgi:hypothetical protein